MKTGHFCFNETPDFSESTRQGRPFWLRESSRPLCPQTAHKGPPWSEVLGGEGVPWVTRENRSREAEPVTVQLASTVESARVTIVRVRLRPGSAIKKTRGYDVRA